MKVADAQENGELFINYFNLVFKRDDCVLLHEDYFSVTLIMITISPSMVREFLNQLNTAKSCGPDEISRLLKKCSKSLSIPLCTLFNKQMDSGCFPKAWKAANLVPVFKSDDRDGWELQRNIIAVYRIKSAWKMCVLICFPLLPTANLPSARRLC